VQPGFEQELIGRHAGDLPKGAKEMIGASRGLAGKIGERQRAVGIKLDQPHRLGDALLVTAARRAAGMAGVRVCPDHRAGNAQAEFLECVGVACFPRGLRFRQQRRKRR